ncbi:MAG: MmcQ/YjbR family DNA-binding protein [Cyclobacteriaceae bacterium]
MDIESYRSYCMAKPCVTEGFPFAENVLVFKVLDKMFALTDVEAFESINLKCDPEKAIELREQYPAVIPGYHMSKKHWNTVMMDGRIPDQLIKSWIDDSYDLVVSKLPKKDRDQLN